MQSFLAWRPWHRASNHAGVFERVHLAPHGAVAWNDEIELCADALYLELTGKSTEAMLPGLRARS